MSALSHIRVLDLTRVLAGPWCTQLLADLGADVIKIERPADDNGRGGDDTRGWGPPFLDGAADSAVESTQDSAYFLCANRGKRSVTLDIATLEGQAVVRTLAQQCDVVVENFRVGQLQKFGLDYASLHALNPRLIYCSITGFGQTGPRKDQPGYDFVVQGQSGLMSITGEPDGSPQKVGVAVTDIGTGLYATVAILAALEQRHVSGAGQHLDLALFDTALAMLANVGSSYLVSGKEPQRWGNAHASIVPYDAFEASDGWFIVAAGTDAQFSKVCELIGAEDLASDTRFATNRARVQHRAELMPLLRAAFKQRDKAMWLQQLADAGVPGGPINTVPQAFADMQVQARELKLDLPHASGARVPGVAAPIRMSHTPLNNRRAPPTLGQHTDEVLRELAQIDEATLARLHKLNII